MITLYRRSDSRRADEIEEQLRELVVAHRVVDVDESGEQPPAEADMPVITETGRVYADPRSIRDFLAELRKELELSRIFSADACYVDPDDPSRCI